MRPDSSVRCNDSRFIHANINTCPEPCSWTTTGTSPTESYCKALTGRLKGRGRRWDRPNAEALMALAAVQHSDLWAAYWQQQLHQAA